MDRYRINEFNATRAMQRREHLKYRMFQLGTMLGAAITLIMAAK